MSSNRLISILERLLDPPENGAKQEASPERLLLAAELSRRLAGGEDGGNTAGQNISRPQVAEVELAASLDGADADGSNPIVTGSDETFHDLMSARAFVDAVEAGPASAPPDLVASVLRPQTQMSSPLPAKQRPASWLTGIGGLWPATGAVGLASVALLATIFVMSDHVVSPISSPTAPPQSAPAGRPAPPPAQAKKAASDGNSATRAAERARSEMEAARFKAMQEPESAAAGQAVRAQSDVGRADIADCAPRTGEPGPSKDVAATPTNESTPSCPDHKIVDSVKAVPASPYADMQNGSDKIPAAGFFPSGRPATAPAHSAGTPAKQPTPPSQMMPASKGR